MSWRPLRMTVPLLALLLAACGGGDEPDDTTAFTTTSPSTTVPVSTSTSSSSSTSTSSTSTSSTTSTTVAPGVDELTLGPTGLGTALFGAEPESVIRYVGSILGGPTDDTGWVAPTALGAPCPGSQVRFVTWGDLVLFFTDDSPAASGTRHFASYTYGPPLGAEIVPLGMTTVGGITVGSTVRDLLIAHPGAVVNPEDEISGPSFQIEDGLFGFLTGIGDGDTVISFIGGFGCGE